LHKERRNDDDDEGQERNYKHYDYLQLESYVSLQAACAHLETDDELITTPRGVFIFCRSAVWRRDKNNNI